MFFSNSALENEIIFKIMNNCYSELSRKIEKRIKKRRFKI
jgi:hypothetical protein